MTISLTDALGRTVRTAVDAQCKAGVYSATIDMRGMETGVYYVAMRTRNQICNREVLVVR